MHSSAIVHTLSGLQLWLREEIIIVFYFCLTERIFHVIGYIFPCPKFTVFRFEVECELLGSNLRFD